MVFSKQWLRNHGKFLLHFLIHIDVLMLCRKFELILSSNSGVMSTFKKLKIMFFYCLSCTGPHLQSLCTVMMARDLM